MSVAGDQMLAASDRADDVAHGVDIHLVEPNGQHLFLDALDNFFLLKLSLGMAIISRRNREMAGS